MKKNKIFSFLIVGAIALNTMTINVQAIATLNVVDEYIERETISKGLVYEYKQKLTDQGVVDVYVLDYDMNEPNIDIDILRSNDWAKRDTLTNLIKDEGAVAGVNASFFDTSATYSDPLGLEVENGSVSYAKENYNKTVANANSIMIDRDNNVSIGYVSSNIKLYNEAGVTLYVNSINGMQDFGNANVFNRNAMYDTSSIDAKQWQYKFVVDGGVITYIANPKEVVVIPENGYVITANTDLYNKLLPNMPRGTKMFLSVSTNIPEKFPRLDLLLSGGGTLLKNGEVVLDGIMVQASSRAPRTAIGYTADNHIICMVVDGRGVSKGATLTEMAYYMKQYGVTDAINLDGGGSSMIAHKNTDNQVELDNVPSDGVQRKVTNGVGFVTTNPVGYSDTIQIISKGRTFVNTNMPLDIVGYDVNLNKAYVDKNIVQYSVEGVSGYFQGHNFVATSTGIGTITAKHGNNIGTTQVIVQDEILDINISQSSSEIKPNETVTLYATALDKDGYSLPYSTNNITFTSTLGDMNGNVFTSNGQVGGAVITATIGNITKNVYVGVGSEKVRLTSFENGMNITPMKYPDTVFSNSKITNEVATDGSNSLKLFYLFNPTGGDVQAGYAKLDNVIINSPSKSITLDIVSEPMDNAVNGKIIDANNVEYTINFAGNITNQKTTATAQLPTGMAYPVKLDRLYVVSTSTKATEMGSVYFDNVYYNTGYSKPVTTTPTYPVYDTKYTANQSQLNIAGKITVADSVVNQVASNLGSNTPTIFGGITTNHAMSITNGKLKSSTYKATNNDGLNTTIIELNTKSDTVINSDSNQWKSMLNDIKVGKDNVVIIANYNPTSSSYDKIEGRLLKSRLEEIQQSMGKNIYWVDCNSNVNNVKYVEGIRYVSLAKKSYNSSNASERVNVLGLYNEDGVLKYSLK